MKKNYITPNTTSVIIRTQLIFAASAKGINFDGNGGGSVTVQGGDAESAAMGRGGSVWDDEE